MKLRGFIVFIGLLLFVSACNITKYVPDGEYLLDKVTIKTDNKNIKRDDLKEYLRQTPNAAVFGAWRMQLGLYNWAPIDTTKWLNHFLNKTFKKIGDPPVIYNSSLTSLSVQQLQRLLENKGYVNAKVKSSVTTKSKKIAVDYIINLNKPYTLRDYKINFKNKLLTEIASDTTKSLIHSNMLFDVDVFNAERDRIATGFRQLGYYNFNKEYLTYTSDSTLNSHQVNSTLELRDYLKRSADSTNSIIFRKYSIRKVIFYTKFDANTSISGEENAELDTVQFRNFQLISPKRKVLKLDALVQNTYINPNTVYTDEAVEKTYSALNSLGPIKYVNISFKDVGNNMLDCEIVIIPSKPISVSTELEGTYTAGYWGVAGNVNIVNRNIFKGAETLSLLARGAFEWQDGVWAREYGGQIGLKFPRFIMPFASYDFKRNIHANTELTGSFSYQDRPGEFTTTNAGAGINYSWKQEKFRHALQLFELNFVQFPKIEIGFRNKYLNPLNPIFNPYNYEDHLIWRLGYGGTYTSFNTNRPLQNYSVTRYSVETAGNLLNGLNHLFGKPDTTGFYTLFNVRFAQYVKGEFNITRHQIFDKDNRFVYHLDVGLGVPYGNGDVIPFEKRFYSGGANSVRGWGESTLGPGTYQRINGISRDFNQVGDIKLDMNMEYRAKLFWVMEGAAFLDAGNIWTIKSYNTQKGGVFQFNSFLSQIAIAYGVGARLDFKFFIFRFDVGVKLYDPSQVSRLDKWRITPQINKDFALNFAIGYPF